MNEKITHQIEEMKKQTIGVEVEMNSITREQSLQPNTSEQDATRIQHQETATSHGQHGMDKAENGNSRRMSALPEMMHTNAKW